MRSAALVPAVAAALALAVLAPLLGRGFVLSYDMVFAQRQWLLPDSIGLGAALPRSVPSDAVVALTTWAVPGDILQKFVLAAALFAAALGAGRLIPTESLGIRVVAAVSYSWTAYVAERLFIGHWQLLLAYGCLPWITMAGLALRRGEPKAAVRLILACAPAMLVPGGGLLAALTAMVSGGARRLWFTAGAMVVLNAPWWLPAVLRGSGALSTSDGVTAFAARAESWGTPVISLLGLGGIWNSEVVPISRTNPLVPLLTLATVAAALFGLRLLARRWGIAPARSLVLLGAFGVAVAALTTIPAGVDLVRWLTERLPGAGLLRDAQRWVAWWALPLALGFALAVEAAMGYLRAVAARRAVLAAAALFPMMIMPDLAWAGWGRLESVDYPDDWARVSEVLAADARNADVLSLPLSAFRRFGWNGERTQLDPAPRALPRPVVIDDTLYVAGRPLGGEDPRAAAVRQALATGGDLGRLGIGWVLVERGTPGRIDPSLLTGLHLEYEGPWLTLYRLPGDVEPYRAPGPPLAPVLLADLAALSLVMFCLLWRVLPTSRLSAVNRILARE